MDDGSFVDRFGSYFIFDLLGRFFALRHAHRRGGGKDSQEDHRP